MLLTIPLVIVLQGVAAVLLLDAGMPVMIAVSSAVVVAALVAWWLLACGQPWRTLGFSRSVPAAAGSFTTGIVAGVALMAVIVGIGLLAGAWSLGPVDAVDWRGIALWTGVLALAALFEEVWLRGVVLQDLARSSLAAGLVVSSLLFALLHLGNPNVTIPIIALLIVNIGLAGLLLSAAFLQSRDLYLPTGLHLGWNAAQAMLFGLPVSGIQLPSVLRGSMNADASPLLAAPFGPESSLLTTAVLGTIACAWLVRLLRGGARLPVQDEDPTPNQALPNLPAAPPERPAITEGEAITEGPAIREREAITDPEAHPGDRDPRA